jgi:hypothetical protein
MIGLLCFVLAVLASPFKSKLRLEAENAVLRHQLIVLRRRLHGRVRLAGLAASMRLPNSLTWGAMREPTQGVASVTSIHDGMCALNRSSWKHR